jgi:23S rRNA-intervening sequence protein
MKQELPAVQKAYDLAKELMPRIAKYPKDYKFSLGQRITDHSLDILELLLQAAYAKHKLSFLDEANLKLERQRYLLRLSSDLGALPHKGYEHIMKMVTELGKQIGGWRKQAASKG